MQHNRHIATLSILEAATVKEHGLFDFLFLVLPMIHFPLEGCLDLIVLELL